MLKDIAEEKDFKFAKLDEDRQQHYQKVQDKYAKLDKLGYVAFQDHIVEVDARQEQAKKEEKDMAVEAHHRSTLADQHYVNMHKTAQEQDDREAKQCM